MKNLFLLLSVLNLISCSKSENPKPAPGPSTETQTDAGEFDFSWVKYPAAIVFEGGTGDPTSDSNGRRHKAAWRVYLCLKKQTAAIPQTIEFDFSTLENPPQLNMVNLGTNEILRTESLKKAVLTYQYTATISTSVGTSGFSYGFTHFNSTSKQDWDLLYVAPGQASTAHDPVWDLNIFNLNAPNNTHASMAVSKYEVSGERHYISQWLERFTFKPTDEHPQFVTACEQGTSEQIWQFGDDITD